MQIRALKRLVGSYGTLEKREVADLPKFLAVELIALGHVEAVEAAADVEPEAIEPPAKTRGRKNAAR